MWQTLTDELAGRDFTVLAVAMDEPEAARPWIEAAGPTYPCLIDREHRLADLYHMVNVPQAVWIDETGRIVRPPENAGAMDSLRYRDKTNRQLPDDKLAERERMKAAYVAAVRDWVINGSASEHVLDAATVRARTRLPDATIATAHAHFRLARHLERTGNTAEAAVHAAEASRLHPESWNIWRQAAAKDPTGLATSPAFWARVDSLGERPYYLPIEMKGIAQPD